MADETIERKASPRQSVFAGKQDYLRGWYHLFERWTKQMVLDAPARGSDNRVRDRWLRNFWKQEPLLSGVLSSVITIDKNRGWYMTGGRNQVARFTKVLRNANPTISRGLVVSAEGWRRFCARQAGAFWGSDVGAVTDKGERSERNPLEALWSVDPTTVVISGDGITHYDINENEQHWQSGSYFITQSVMEQDDIMPYVGYSALSRAIDLAIIMVSVYRHDREMLFSAMQKGLLLMQGIDDSQWETAMQTHAERLTQKEREFFGGLSIFFGDESMDAKLVSLSQLPDNFSLSEFSNILMYGYALCFGYDPREFWPVSGGTLGTGAETEAQALKASGKGGLDFALAFQDALQRELPETLQFEFEQRNEQGQIIEAQVAEAWAQAINTMASSPIAGAETLTREQRMILLAERGLIPQEWTLEEEDVTATDTETAERQRLLEIPYVRRACEVYHNEPIVTYSWPAGKERVIWQSGAQAIQRRSYPIAKAKRRQIEVPVPDSGNETIDGYLEGFAEALAGIVYDYQSGRTGKAEFDTAMNELITGAGLNTFLGVSGQQLGDLDPEQLDVIQEYIKVNQDSINGLAAYIEEQEDDDEGALPVRLFLWVTNLMGLAYTAAVLSAPEQNYRFELGNTIEHCEDCLRLNGQVHPGSAWYTSGLMPQSRSLECGGWNCDCRLIATNEAEQGGF